MARLFYYELSRWEALACCRYVFYCAVGAILISQNGWIQHADWHVTALVYILAHWVLMWMAATVGHNAHLRKTPEAMLRRPIFMTRVVLIGILAFYQPMVIAGLYELISGIDVNKGGKLVVLLLGMGVGSTLVMAMLTGLGIGWDTVQAALPGTRIQGRYMKLI
jgi:hypothetical protein